MPTLIQELSQPQALAEAKLAAESHFTLNVASIREAEEQGMYSQTFVVSLLDGSEHIVQLKDNEIDLTKAALSRALLGDIVPSMHAAKTKEVYFAYVSSMIPRPYASWFSRSWSRDHNIHLAAQAGRLIAKCSLGISSAGVVDSAIIPRLHKILEKEELDADGRARIEVLLSRIDELKSLPLALCHVDLNDGNFIVDDDANIVGLIDWEQASLLPFGVNACCIRLLAVMTAGGVDRVNEDSLPMAQAFWETLTVDIARHLHPAVITSMLVGYFITQVFIEGSTPSDLVRSYLVERHDWLESMFRSLCDA